MYAVSDAGTLAYVPGNPQWDLQRMVWVDDKGKIDPLPTEPRPYWTPAVISPSGQHAAIAIRGSTVSIWSYDFSRATLTPLTSGLSSQFPVWTPDGKRIVYRGTRSGFRNLYWKTIDGSSEEERLTTSPIPRPTALPEAPATAGGASDDRRRDQLVRRAKEARASVPEVACSPNARYAGGTLAQSQTR